MTPYYKKLLPIFLVSIFFLSSCGIYKKTDARKVPTNANERIKKNMEEGRGFRLGSLGKKSGGDFQFASSNPLWRATLAKLDFAPLNNVDYAGGIIVTDWFSDGSSNEQLKITIRFLTNEIRSDALDVNVFYKECSNDLTNCKVTQKDNELVSQITLSILKKASQYEKERIDKYKKENPYEVSTPTKQRDLPKKK